MVSELNYKITVDKVLQRAIERLVDIIGDCLTEFELNNNDIVDIFI